MAEQISEQPCKLKAKMSREPLKAWNSKNVGAWIKFRFLILDTMD